MMDALKNHIAIVVIVLAFDWAIWAYGRRIIGALWRRY